MATRRKWTENGYVDVEVSSSSIKKENEQRRERARRNAASKPSKATESTGIINATSGPAGGSRPGDVATPALDSFTGTSHNAGMSRAVNATQAARQSVMPSAWGAKEGQDKQGDAAAELAAALTSGKPTGDTWEDENAAARLQEKRRSQVSKITGDWTGDAAMYLQSGGDIDEAAVRGTEAMGARAASGAVGGTRNAINMAGYMVQDFADTAKDPARAVGVNEQFAADFDRDPEAMKPFNEWKASLAPGEYEALEMNGQLPDPRTLYANAKQAEAEKEYREKNGELELHRITDLGEEFQNKVQEDYGDIEGGWKVAGDVAETIGQQAPAMLLRAVPYAGAALSTAYLFGSAGGGATEQALKEGAKAEDALSYGVMTGITEAATERMFDGMAGLLGKGAADDAIEGLLKNIRNTGARNFARLGLGAAGEGAEELVSAIADPALKTIYNNKDLTEAYKDDLDWGDVLYQSAMGLLTGGVMGSVGLVNGQYQALNDRIESRLEAEIMNAAEQTPAVQQVLENIQTEEAAETEAPATEGRMFTQPVNRSEANRILHNAEQRARFEQETGVSLDNMPVGQAARIIMEYSRQSAETGATGFETAYPIKTPQAPKQFVHALTRGEAQRVADDPTLRQLFEAETGRKIPGKKFAVDFIMNTTAQLAAQRNAPTATAPQTPTQELATALTGQPSQNSPINNRGEISEATGQAPIPAATETAQDSGTAGEQIANTANQGQSTTPRKPRNTLGIRPEQNVMEETPGAKPSQTVETAQATEATTDEFSELIDQTKEKGGFRYIPISNSDSVTRATRKIKSMGWAPAVTAWSNDVQRGQSGAEMTAMGALLYNNAVNSGDTKLAMQILGDYAMLGRNTAQGLQAFQILKTLTPNNQLYAIESQLAKLSEKLANKLPDGIQLSEELKEAYLNAETDEARDAVIEQMQQDVADQIPSTLKDKWTALRYMNMLGNFRTQGRNIIGNTLMAATTSTKNGILRMLEGAVKFVNPNYERTVSLTVDPELRKLAAEEFKENEKFISGESKYADNTLTTDSFMQGVQDKRRIFSLAPAEAYRKATKWATESGDKVFIGRRYARSLAGYLKANGIDAQTFAGIRNGSIQPTAEQSALLDRARNFAIREAQESTFHDSNVVSDWISKFGRRENTPKLIRALSEGLMPFRKTPANVAMRMYEYSPLGVVDAVVKEIKLQSGNGNVTGSDVLNSLSKGFTGTGMFLLGMLLRARGLLRGKEEDEKQSAFDDLRGEQDYSLILDDGTSITMDWVSPLAATVFMGSQLYDLIEEGGFQIEDLGEMVTRLSDPLIQMSMLQGVNDTMNNLRNSKNGLGQIAENLALSYLTQGLTNSLLGQAERTYEDRRYSTFRDSSTPFGRNLQNVLGKASAKTPGLDYNQVEYIDAWGRAEETGDPLSRALNNFLNPGFVSRNNSTAVDDELQRLYDSGFQNVFPTRRGMTDKISVYDKNGNRTDERSLTADEYVTYQKVKGQTSLQMLQDLMESRVWEGMTDDAKADAVSDIYKYATNAADLAVEPTSKDEYAEISKLSDTPAYFGAKSAFGEATANRYDRDYGAVEDVLDSLRDMPADVRDYLLKKNDKLRKVQKAADAGLPVRAYYAAQDAVDDIVPLNGKDEPENWQKYNAIVGCGLKDKETDIVMSQYLGDNQLKAYNEARSEGVRPKTWAKTYSTIAQLEPAPGAKEPTAWQKYDAIVKNGGKDTEALLKCWMAQPQNGYTYDRYQLGKERGFKTSTLIDAYRICKQGSKKADIIPSLQEAGYSKWQSEFLWELWEGNNTISQADKFRKKYKYG